MTSLRIGKHRIVKNIASLRKVNIAHPYTAVPLATWFMSPPTRQPATFPMKKVLAIQEPTWRSIWIGSPGIVPFIILGMATLENDIHPPTHIAPNDTLTADRS